MTKLIIEVSSVEDAMRAIAVLNAYIGSKEPESTGTPIDDMAISVRTMNCLKSEDITTCEQLDALGLWQLRRIPNLGKKSIEEIHAYYAARRMNPA